MNHKRGRNGYTRNMMDAAVAALAGAVVLTCATLSAQTPGAEPADLPLVMVPVAHTRTIAPDWRQRIDDPGCLAPVVYRRQFNGSR